MGTLGALICMVPGPQEVLCRGVDGALRPSNSILLEIPSVLLSVVLIGLGEADPGGFLPGLLDFGFSKNQCTEVSYVCVKCTKLFQAFYRVHQ